jgi:hypothetical protein
MFFFEKKNQKTFATGGPGCCPRVGSWASRSQKFFASFFQKRSAFFMLSNR